MEFSYSKKHLVAFQAQKKCLHKNKKFPNNWKSPNKLEQVMAQPTTTNPIADQLNELRDTTA